MDRMEFETSQYFGKESNILLVRISNTIIMEKLRLLNCSKLQREWQTASEQTQFIIF